MRTLTVLTLSVALGSTATAQIQAFAGPSPNIAAAAVDFEPPTVTGPVPANIYMGTGITSVTQVGTGWNAAGDVVSAGLVNGQCLVSQGGVPAIAALGDALDNLGTGDGWDIVLDNPADEFQCSFPDQTGFPFDVELFLGATSLGTGSFTGPGAPSLIYFRAGNSQFDRILITSTAASGGYGIDDLGFGNGPPPPPFGNVPGFPECVETTYASNNGGNVGGAVYFDMTLTQNVTFSGLELNTGVSGQLVGLEFYTIPGTYVGNAGSMAGWTLQAADDGMAVGNGTGVPTPINFAAPFTLAAGTYGVALVGNNQLTAAQLDHDYTNGTGSNQLAESGDMVISLSLGAADNVPFQGGGFSPRVWNGRLCHGLANPGTNYCSPAVANSTGNPAVMGAQGSTAVADNNLTLEATDMPQNAFGFFLTSMTQGNVPQPGGSQGVLCLGGAIGRYVGPGQIQNSGTAGMISLAVDLTQHPTPTGLVSVMPGETWNFQAWFRDSVGGTATSNFTDGLTIAFQ